MACGANKLFQVMRNMIMSLTLKMKGGLRVRCVPLGM